LISLAPAIAVVTPRFRPRRLRHVLFDWDGTLSLVRGGWAELMLEVFAEALPSLAGESDDARRQLAHDEIMRLNGRPSIHQMERLAELTALRSGTLRSADEYQACFQQRLGERTQRRFESMRSADELLVTGAREILAAFRKRGVALSLASGTPIDQLQHECSSLGVAEFFEGRIHGPRDLADRTFSKHAVLAALANHRSDAIHLAAIGDGTVELENVREFGGLAVALAADEERPGHLDAAKQRRLLESGAEVVLAHFGEAERIVDLLLDGAV
jgi:phosphoglycolate phosphatase-like HAD superfamily hydrolase